MPVGKIEIVPTTETALGVLNLREIVRASPRVKSCVLGAEDLAADLMAVRTPQAVELAYASCWSVARWVSSRSTLHIRIRTLKVANARLTGRDNLGIAARAQ